MTSSPPDAVPLDRTSDATHVVTDPRRQRRILISMCMALVAVVASVSGLNVAQQDLAIDLGASQSALLWIINGYTMTLAALLLPIGAIGDRWGRKPILLAGLGIFALANLAAAFAETSTTLLIARVIAGAGAAMIMPVTLSVITSSFPPDRRAQAVGVWAGFAGAGGVMGLFFSALMVDVFTWPWLFAMPITLAVAAGVIAIGAVNNSREEIHGRFDTVGSILSAIAIGGLVLGIHEGPEMGWTYPLTVIGLVAGSIALVAFVIWELRIEHPLLPVRLFANRSLATGSVTLLAVFAVMFGLFLVLIQYLQAVLGYSALGAASGLIPMAALMMSLANTAPRLVASLGTTRVLATGVTLMIGGLLSMALLASADGGYWSVLPGLLLLGSGLGLSMTPSTSAITEALPLEQQGVASALNDTVRELGGALGIALIGSVLNSGYRASIATTTDSLPPEAADIVEQGIGGGLGVAESLGPDGEPLADAVREAFVDGWVNSMWIATAVIAAALVFILTRGPRANTAPTTSGDAQLERRTVDVAELDHLA
jgi:EmrB/QacA subfamily drug resistance transporter